jgi:hypothetical protein
MPVQYHFSLLLCILLQSIICIFYDCISQPLHRDGRPPSEYVPTDDEMDADDEADDDEAGIHRRHARQRLRPARHEPVQPSVGYREPPPPAQIDTSDDEIPGVRGRRLRGQRCQTCTGPSSSRDRCTCCRHHVFNEPNAQCTCPREPVVSARRGAPRGSARVGLRGRGEMAVNDAHDDRHAYRRRRRRIDSDNESVRRPQARDRSLSFVSGESEGSYAQHPEDPHDDDPPDPVNGNGDMPMPDDNGPPGPAFPHNDDGGRDDPMPDADPPPPDDDDPRDNLSDAPMEHADDPCPDDGWKWISAVAFASYRLHTRGEGPFTNHLHKMNRLCHEYVIHCWITAENHRIAAAMKAQDDYRTDKLNAVKEAYRGGKRTGDQIGKVKRMNRLFVGGRKWYHDHYLKSMAIVRDRGPGDLMITMTCNPKWDEIQKQLYPGQTAMDRPDIVAKVFKLKLDALLADLWTGRAFGRAVAYVHVIEFQKRGLPHAHIILWLHKNDKLNTPEKIDAFISAEVPDPIYEPELHELVTEFMVHGPCGEKNPDLRCMRFNKAINRKRCKYHYPKNFVDKTTIADNGFVTYRRRLLAHRWKKIRRQQVGPDARLHWDDYTVTSADIVPYNKALLMKYRCHINVEVCTGVRMIKYLHKYVYKGCDRINVKGVKMTRSAAQAPQQPQAGVQPANAPPQPDGLRGVGHPLPVAAGGQGGQAGQQQGEVEIDEFANYVAVRYV